MRSGASGTPSRKSPAQVQLPAGISTVSPSAAASMVRCTSISSHEGAPPVVTTGCTVPALQPVTSKPEQSVRQTSVPPVKPGSELHELVASPRSLPSQASPGSVTPLPHEGLLGAPAAPA